MLLLALTLACGGSAPPEPPPPLQPERLPTFQEAAEANRPRAVGDLAPDQPLPRVGAEGQLTVAELLEQEDTRGVLAMFLADWCGVCTEALPVVNALGQEHEGLQLLLYSTDANEIGRRRLTKRLTELGVDAPVIMGPPFTQRAWMGEHRPIPQFFFVDGSGRIVAHEVGFDEEVRSRLDGHARAAVGTAR